MAFCFCQEPSPGLSAALGTRYSIGLALLPIPSNPPLGTSPSPLRAAPTLSPDPQPTPATSALPSPAHAGWGVTRGMGMLWRPSASVQALPSFWAHNQDVFPMVLALRGEPRCPTDAITALHAPSQQLEMLNAPIPRPMGTGGFWKPLAIHALCPERLYTAAVFYGQWISPPSFTAFYDVLLIGFVELFYRFEVFPTSAVWT